MLSFTDIIGEGKDLTASQMCIRGFIVFLIAYVLIRISGRRSFRFRSPLDNVIAILLGAILSRAVVGASPFLPVILTSLSIVVLHRLLMWSTISFPKISRLSEGKRLVLYEDGKFLDKNLMRGLLNKEEVIHQVRAINHCEDLSAISRIYMEKDGEITIVNKKQ